MKIKSKMAFLSFAAIAAVSVAGLANLNVTISAEDQPVLNGRVFYSTKENGEGKIKNSNLDGSDVKDVIVSPTDSFDEPRVSPDGTKIAYTRIPNGLATGKRVGNIFISTVNGEGTAQLTTSGFDSDIYWSPDMSYMVFSSSRDYNLDNYPSYESYKMDSDGSGQTRLTSNSYYDGNPVITFDNKIILQNESNGLFGTLYIMNNDGSSAQEITQILSAGFTGAGNADLSHDRTKLAFRGATTPTGIQRIGYIDLLTMRVIKVSIGPNAESHQMPAIFPDGKTAYFRISAGSVQTTNIINLKTGQITLLNNHLVDRVLHSIQPLTLRPSLKPNASIETNPMGQYNVSSNNTDAYDGLDLSSIQIISGDASVDRTTGIITTSSSKDSSSKDVTYKVCSLSNPNLCSTFTIKSNLTTDVIGVPNTGVSSYKI